MKFYETKYQAYKNKKSDETVRKVDGGYLVMTWAEYYTCKNQN